MNKRNFLIVCLLGMLLVFAVGLASCDNGHVPSADDGKYPGSIAGNAEVGGEGNIYLWIKGEVHKPDNILFPDW